MPKKRKKSPAIPRWLILACIITGIATLVLKMANNRLKIPELAEVAAYAGTAFVISLLIIIGIFVVRHINKK
jgi:hypothetical protein